MIASISIIDTSIPWDKCKTKRQIIKELSDAVNTIVSSNDYGESIEKLLIGLIAVEPIYDKFAKPRRPRYTEHKEIVVFGSIPIVINKTLEIEIKLDYEQILAAEGEELRKIVAKKVLNTLQNTKPPKKVTDFDKDRFVTDIETYFNLEHLMD